MTLNQGHLWYPRQVFEFKRRSILMDLNSVDFIEFKGSFRMKIGSNFEWTWINWAHEYFPNISRFSFEVLRIKPRQIWCVKWWRDYWWNDGTKSAWQWWMDRRAPAIDSRDWQGTCIGIIIRMWNIRMTRWLGGKSHDLEITVLEHAKVMVWHIACWSCSWCRHDHSRWLFLHTH
jgi:hypothetical protein